MLVVGRKLYYELTTGIVIVDTGERINARATTTEEDYEAFIALYDKNPETIGCIELAFKQYADNFANFQIPKVNINVEPHTVEFFTTQLATQQLFIEEQNEKIRLMQEAINVALGITE